MSRKIIFKSSDGESFEVDEAVALQAQAISHLIEEDSGVKEIPLLNVTGKILAKVIEYCKKHVDPAAAAAEKAVGPKSVKDQLKKWDADFIKVDTATLFDLVAAANYMDITELLDLTTTAVAEMMKGKSSEEINKQFNTAKNFTPEDEEEVRQAYPWVFK